jgi:hypothetical protein
MSLHIKSACVVSVLLEIAWKNAEFRVFQCFFSVLEFSLQFLRLHSEPLALFLPVADSLPQQVDSTSNWLDFYRPDTNPSRHDGQLRHTFPQIGESSAPSGDVQNRAAGYKPPAHPVPGRPLRSDGTCGCAVPRAPLAIRLQRAAPGSPERPVPIAAWQRARNDQRATVNWKFMIIDARAKLKRLYPVMSKSP